MPSILILAATDRPENRSKRSVVLTQLAEAELVAGRLLAEEAMAISLCLATASDADQIDSERHPSLSALPKVEPGADLARFDALVVLPPADTEKVLHPCTAETLSHFMEHEKFFAVCSRTLIALRWMLTPDTIGMHKCDDVRKDAALGEAIRAYVREHGDISSRAKSGVFSRLFAVVRSWFSSSGRQSGSGRRLRMKDGSIDFAELANEVRDGLRDLFSELLEAHPDRTFYTFALFTDDSLQFAHAAANTEEGLVATVRRYRKEVDPGRKRTSTRNNMRWSYGDWEFFPVSDEQHLGQINAILQENFDADSDVFELQLEPLWEALLEGFRLLDREGFLGKGRERSKITLLLVGHVPEERAEEWVLALNPDDVAQRYLTWDADAPDLRNGAS